MKWYVPLPVSLLLIASLPCARAQNGADPYARRPIQAVKITAPPAIDGDLSDPVWKTAPRATDFTDRQNATVVADQTIAYIVYDERYIYVAFHCKDTEPDKITARETIRDSKYTSQWDDDSEDNVEVVFDPFLAYRWDDLTRFSVNAIGTRSARLAGGRGGKVEWKGDWDGAAKRVEDGWTAEMRIPWAILHYPSSKQPITMGINFRRFQYRTRITSLWSNTGPQGWNELQGRWTGVQVPTDGFRSQLSVLPYILPGSDRSNSTFRTGLDLRYTLTPQLTVVSTINPDFATIEGAVEGIQFSRSERFVPEKRPFFLEGRDYFDAGNFFAVGPYFYSNRIETFDAGMKVYGKITPRDSIGFLSAFDFGRRSDVVARYQHNLSATADVGLFFTQRSAKSENNTVGVLDQRVRWGKLGLSSQWAISTGTNAGGPAKQVNLTYEDARLFWSLQFLDVSPRFQDANGLIFFNDFRGIHLYSFWYSEWRKGFWRAFNVSFFPQYDWYTSGRPFRRGAGFEMEMVARSDWSIGLSTEYQKFDDQTDFTYGLRLRNGVSNRFRQFGIRLSTGRLADRPASYIGPDFSVRILRKLDIAYGGAILNLDGSVQQHILTMNYEISPTRSLGGRVVIQDADTNWYVSYRNSGARGTEVYFILGDPNARRFVERAAVKFVFVL